MLYRLMFDELINKLRMCIKSNLSISKKDCRSLTIIPQVGAACWNQTNFQHELQVHPRRNEFNLRTYIILHRKRVKEDDRCCHSHDRARTHDIRITSQTPFQFSSQSSSNMIYYRFKSPNKLCCCSKLTSL